MKLTVEEKRRQYAEGERCFAYGDNLNYNWSKHKRRGWLHAKETHDSVRDRIAVKLANKRIAP